MRTIKTPHQQKGVALGVILGAIALIAAIGFALVSGSRQTTTNTATEKTKLDAAALMTQGVNLRDGVTRMLSNGVDVNNITADAAANTGLYHPTDGGAVQQVAPPTAVTTATDWALGDVQANAVGTTSGDDVIVYMGNVTQSVCGVINTQLRGDSTIPAAGVALADFAAGTAADLSAVAGATSEACVEETGGAYVYYTVVAAS